MGATILQFAVAILMGMGAVCIFVWAALSGMFADVEGIAERVYRTEVGDDESRD